MRGKDGHADLTTPNRTVDFIKQLVPRLHRLVVQERPHVEHCEVVIEQGRHCSLGVDASVVNEDVARLPAAHNSALQHHC